MIAFNEVALAWLRRVAVPSATRTRPTTRPPSGWTSCRTCRASSSFIIDHNVRFTVRGEIFKTTEKRILQELIPNPGRELAREEVLNFIYGFSRHARLIESTGERTFALTSQGRDWEPRPLEDKMKTLLEYTIEERQLGGEYFHQAQMRRIYLRLLKRIEVDIWYDLMYLPFLARNTYLSNLDELAVEDYFQAGAEGGRYVAQEDLQRLAWNLVGWVRKRLYLLGLVDLGYDGHGRPVAMEAREAHDARVPCERSRRRSERRPADGRARRREAPRQYRRRLHVRPRLQHGTQRDLAQGNGHWVLEKAALPAATENIPRGQRPNLYDASLKVPTAIGGQGRSPRGRRSARR